MWRLHVANDVDVMLDKRQMLPPRPAPYDQAVQIVTVDRCSGATTKGDGIMFQYFDSVTNTTLLDMALAEYMRLPLSVDRELRLALIKLSKLDGGGCLQHLRAVQQMQPMNERALLYTGYCLEIMGDINGAKDAFLEVKARRVD